MIVLDQSFINSNEVVPQKGKFGKKTGFLFNGLLLHTWLSGVTRFVDSGQIQ